MSHTHQHKPPRYHAAPRARRLLVAALGATLLTAMPSAARAQFGLGGLLGGLFGGGMMTVYDPSAVAKLVAQLNADLEAVATLRSQLDQQRVALAKLANPPWRDLQGMMRALGTTLGDEAGLGYAVRDLDQRFRTTFPVSRVIADWPTEERAQAKRTVATMRAALAATSTQAAAFGAGLDRLGRIKAAVGSIRGHEQALELENAATVFTAEELMLLRQAIMTQANAQAVYYAHQVNAAAEHDETVRALLAAAATSAPRHTETSLRVEP